MTCAAAPAVSEGDARFRHSRRTSGSNKRPLAGGPRLILCGAIHRRKSCTLTALGCQQPVMPNTGVSASRPPQWGRQPGRECACDQRAKARACGCRSAKASASLHPPGHPTPPPFPTSHSQPHHALTMSGRPSFSQLAQKFIQQRAGAAGRTSGGRSSGPSGGQPGGGPSFGQALGGVGGTVLLVGGGLLVNSALFNGKHKNEREWVAGAGRRGWVGGG